MIIIILLLLLLLFEEEEEEEDEWGRQIFYSFSQDCWSNTSAFPFSLFSFSFLYFTWTGWIRCKCDSSTEKEVHPVEDHRKRVGVKHLYNPVPQRIRVSWSQFVEVWVAVRGSENQIPAKHLGPQHPRLNSPAEWERSAAKDKGTWGQYVAVCSVFNSLLTHNPFTTLSQSFRIKCERNIFLKKCVRSSLLLIFFRMYMYTYSSITTIRQSLKPSFGSRTQQISWFTKTYISSWKPFNKTTKIGQGLLEKKESTHTWRYVIKFYTLSLKWWPTSITLHI